jgi:hypothetical protein
VFTSHPDDLLPLFINAGQKLHEGQAGTGH